VLPFDLDAGLLVLPADSGGWPVLVDAIASQAA
jgi:hypothetical protein